MNRIMLVPSTLLLVLSSCLVGATAGLAAPPELVPVTPFEHRLLPANPAIDMPGYLAVAEEAARHRESRRVTEADFIRMSREHGTIVLDARSRENFDRLHVQGALLLAFPDIAIESLARAIPDRNTRILIYCNNNFGGDPLAFASKIARASLNLSTYIALYSYGYRNVYELGPTLDVKDTRIELVGTANQK